MITSTTPLLDVVPPEIWTRCWAYIDDLDTITSVSRVCHVFRNTALPLLFDAIVISPLETQVNLSGMGDRVPAFVKKTAKLNAFASHPTIPSMVQVILFEAAELDSRSPEIAAAIQPEFASQLVEYLQAFMRALTKCTDLRRISLKYGDILVGGGMLSLLALLSVHQNLETLNLFLPKLPTTNLISLPKTAQLWVEDSPLVFYGQPTHNVNQPALLCSPESLRKLVVFSLKLCPAILSGILLNKEHCPILTSLALHIPEPEFLLLLDFLKYCPELTQLHIFKTGSQKSDSFLQLRPEVIVKLNDFYGPLALARALVPGRPVRLIEIQGEPWASSLQPGLADDLKILAQTSVTTTKLALRIPLRLSTQTLFSSITDLFPRLLDFQLTINTDGINTSYNHVPEQIWERIQDTEIYKNKRGEPLEDQFGAFQQEDSLEMRADVGRAKGYKKLIYDIALGKYRLPQGLSKLKLALAKDRHYEIDLEELDIEPRLIEPFTYLMGRRIVHALASHYSTINQLKIGFSSFEFNLWWHKEAGKWKALAKGGI